MPGSIDPPTYNSDVTQELVKVNRALLRELSLLKGGGSTSADARFKTNYEGTGDKRFTDILKVSEGDGTTEDPGDMVELEEIIDFQEPAFDMQAFGEAGKAHLVLYNGFTESRALTEGKKTQGDIAEKVAQGLKAKLVDTAPIGQKMLEYEKKINSVHKGGFPNSAWALLSRVFVKFAVLKAMFENVPLKVVICMVGNDKARNTFLRDEWPTLKRAAETGIAPDEITTKDVYTSLSANYDDAPDYNEQKQVTIDAFVLREKFIYKMDLSKDIPTDGELISNQILTPLLGEQNGETGADAKYASQIKEFLQDEGFERSNSEGHIGETTIEP